jgi:hypothetical protein
MSFRSADGNLYMPVADTEKAFPEATALEADFVLSRLRHGACRRVVLLVDGCNAGAFFANNRGIPDGLFAITACDAQQFTRDTPEGGQFTRALIEGLQRAETDRDGDGRISVEELHDYVKAQYEKHGVEALPQKWAWNVREPIYLAFAAPRVFLSYCREDVAQAKEVRAELEQAGFSVWLDLEGVESGDWKERVTSGLSRARAVVFLMSAQSLQREAVRKELAFAAEEGVPIIPLVLQKIEKREMPNWYNFDFATIHRHELPGSDRGAVMDGLARAIRTARRS